MIPVVTAAEAAAMDERSGIPVGTLMERAGLAVALAAVELGARYGSRVAVLCGPGNNGGDGYVAARYLRRRGVAVSVAVLADSKTDPARQASKAAKTSGVVIGPIDLPTKVDLVVDAVFGGGFRRGIPEKIKAWSKVGVPVVSVDIPSGVDPGTGKADDDAFHADVTVTFDALKPGHLLEAGPSHCGQVQIVDIGLAHPSDVEFEVVEDSDLGLPSRDRHAHKWSAGSVLVVGGSAGMTGAAVLAGRAALNFGAGAVGVASAEPLHVPELLTYPVEDLPIDRFDVVVVGPGLGSRPDIVQEVVGRAGRVVVDADALAHPEMLADSDAELILTPHAGEFSRIAGGPTLAATKALASDIGGVVLLKGSPTFVTDGKEAFGVTSGGPELATIGTGDVLAGMIGALWARGLPPQRAAWSAAHIHGRAAADLSLGTTVTADRLATHIGSWAASTPRST